jgi:hypothetical protein
MRKHILTATILVGLGLMLLLFLRPDEGEGGAASIQGLVVEPDGTPSAGASVTLDSGEGRAGPSMRVSADAQGRFVMSLPSFAGYPTEGLRLSARNGGRSGERVG